MKNFCSVKWEYTENGNDGTEILGDSHASGKGEMEAK